MKFCISCISLNQVSKKILLDHEQQIFLKIQNNITHNFYRIKPIKISSKSKIYEMKIHLEKKNYRIAFQADKSKIEVFYVSDTMKKKNFDQEVRKNVQCQ